MFVIGGRVQLVFTDPYAGVECEVDAIQSGFQRQLVANRASTFLASADGSPEELDALTALYAVVESQGRPVWNLVDGHGPIPPTTAGMLRVPEALMLALVDLWTEPTVEPPAEDSDA